MKLPVSATIEEGACEIDIHGPLGSEVERKNLSIEIFDRRHRKIPFEEGIDSDHIEGRPAASRSDSAWLMLGVQWKDYQDG